ncbi:MAG: molybdate ABC transporter substrate-binding protein [Candidatus Limnocylindrales bacterium]
MHGQGHRRDGGGAIALRATGRRGGGVRWWLAALGALALLVAACTAADEPEQDLTLFAAASLRAVTDELEAAWSEARPEVALTVATEASNVLAARIAEGARGDVFISADAAHPQRLAEEGWTAAAPVEFARNELALVARRDGPVSDVNDLAEPGTRIVVGGPSTPIGRYTALALGRLAQTTSDPEAFAAAVEANIASREDNVRAALAKVELGEGDAAFVYRTDALGSAATVPIELPASARVDAAYSVVQLSSTDDAADFVAWLRGPEARAVLAAAGFVVPG